MWANAIRLTRPPGDSRVALHWPNGSAPFMMPRGMIDRVWSASVPPIIGQYRGHLRASNVWQGTSWYRVGAGMIFALADLHLSFAKPKPMDIFGECWKDHAGVIEANWRRVVDEDDWVLLPGDLSWAMDLEQAMVDLRWIHALPGRKIILRGNHDYWWPGIARLVRELPASLVPLHLNYHVAEERVIVGTRGWLLPGDPGFEDKDQRLLMRETERFRLSVRTWRNSPHADLPGVAVFHFPPVRSDGTGSGFSDLVESEGITTVIYGHLHGSGHDERAPDTVNGVRYILAAADFTGFSPVAIP